MGSLDLIVRSVFYFLVALCKLHLVGDEIDFQLATKTNTQKKNRRVNQICTFCLRERQWKVKYCSTASGSVFIGLSITSLNFLAFEVQEDVLH